MKVIETEYKGYRFRSRLEARWAVFFDACGVKWEYEPEGFDLGDGIYYLPDFLLHDIIIYDMVSPALRKSVRRNYFLKNLWIEVKGNMTKSDDQKIRKFATDNCDDVKNDKKSFEPLPNPIFVVSNVPDCGSCLEDLYWSLFKMAYPYARFDGDEYYDYLCPPFFSTAINADDGVLAPCILNSGRFALSTIIYDYMPLINFEKTLKAYKLARQARFEHGQTYSLEDLRL